MKHNTFIDTYVCGYIPISASERRECESDTCVSSIIIFISSDSSSSSSSSSSSVFRADESPLCHEGLIFTDPTPPSPNRIHWKSLRAFL
ncbi:hypothetical protein QQF64_018245 [Cirrhinus molitorella]|uniref:Uncharacterized protein n=1 Tax=Cirrhinus molitorella TaxID=172907 RepID=A0ABR3LKY5_9TELE